MICIGLASCIRIRIEITIWIRIRIETNADPQHCFIAEFCRTAGEGGGAVRIEGRGGRPGGGGHGSAAGNPGHTVHTDTRLTFSDPHLFRRGSGSRPCHYITEKV